MAQLTIFCINLTEAGRGGCPGLFNNRNQMLHDSDGIPLPLVSRTRIPTSKRYKQQEICITTHDDVQM